MNSIRPVAAASLLLECGTPVPLWSLPNQRTATARQSARGEPHLRFAGRAARVTGLPYPYGGRLPGVRPDQPACAGAPSSSAGATPRGEPMPRAAATTR